MKGKLIKECPVEFDCSLKAYILYHVFNIGHCLHMRTPNMLSPTSPSLGSSTIFTKTIWAVVLLNFNGFGLQNRSCCVVFFFILFIGSAFTRFQTKFLTKSFPTVLSDQLVSYGPCQFPTLGFVVERVRCMHTCMLHAL